ncbi:MAG TPA: hypothetical protein P5132_00425 [Bacteroidales bacterium]|nr:hypothetical protein [Bacteroidales bacterium]
MLKKILAGVLILLIPLSVYFTFNYFKKSQLPEFDVYKAIPLNAVFIFEINDFIHKAERISSSNKIWGEFSGFPSVEPVASDLNYLIELSQKNELISSLLNNNKVIASAHKLAKSEMGFLYLIKLQNFRDPKYLVQLISGLLPANSKLAERNYNSSKIYSFNTNGKVFKFSFQKGILLISTSDILLESAIRQSEVKENLLNDPGFITVQKTAGKNVDINLYINLSLFNQTISAILNNENAVSGFTALGNWAELDINIKNDAVLLNGFTFSNDSLNNYLNLFLNQEPVEHEIIKILPSNTSVFLFFGLSNTSQYLKNYKQYLEKSGKINQYQLQIDRYKNKYAIDIENLLKRQLNEEIGIVITDAPAQNNNDKTYIIMRIHSKSIVEEEIKQLVEKIAERENLKKSELISDLRIDKETTFNVYKLPLKNMYRTFLGSIIPDFDNQYLTFIDNFMVIAHSKNALSEFVHANILQKTLNNDLKFGQFSDYLSSKSNFFFYTNLFRSPEFISDLLNPELKKGMQNNIESFKKFQAFAVQFQQNNSMIYNNLYLQYIPEIKEEAVTVWESYLDTSTLFKPFLFTNHYTQENEIFVQDLNHKIYLINKVGRILWKLPLDEKINSEIYQVDFYKNGKYQLLFSTENKIHLIDRNGNYVERYPQQLRSPATAGIALFDYDKNLDYRIFVPCRNKNIYVYDIEGTLIKGWEFKQTDTYVTKPVQHFRIKNNDYIVFADKYRVYILNRRGEERINVRNQIAKSANNSFHIETAHNEPQFITTDTSGLIKMIALDGQVESKSVSSFSEKHFFDMQDINADGFKDFIYLDENKLSVYKSDKALLFDYTFNVQIDTPPFYYYFSYDDRKIGVVSRNSNQIFLFNNDGSLYEGFPLKGCTPFTIGYLENSKSQFNLITGTPYNFLYNYSVH